MSRSFFGLCQKARKNPQYKGFTLVEVLVTAVILGVVAVGLGASFFSGMKLWNRIKSVDFERTSFLLDLELLGRDLRQSLVFPSIGFQGDPMSVSFPLVKDNKVVKMTYFFEPTNQTLTRRIEEFKNSSLEQQNKLSLEKSIFSAQQVTFQYLISDQKELKWQDSCLLDKAIPQAVWIKGNYKGEAFSKKIFLPSA